MLIASHGVSAPGLYRFIPFLFISFLTYKKYLRKFVEFKNLFIQTVRSQKSNVKVVTYETQKLNTIFEKEKQLNNSGLSIKQWQ